jgi:hypothetical protein
MTAHTLDAKSPSQMPPTALAVLRTPKEAAQFLKLSTSWLAKARMRGDGPPYIKFGRSIRSAKDASCKTALLIGTPAEFSEIDGDGQ